MKIRLEGTKRETDTLLLKLDRVLSEASPIQKIKSVSKFYSNEKQRSTLPVFGTTELGRVYIELE